jgi:MoaA/NifB/PqqE/SkfB family radical SAM enzyme
MVDWIEYKMRGGKHCNPKTEAFEAQIAKMAFEEWIKSPVYMEKGLEWTFNWFHFSTHYWTQNPEMLKYVKEVKPYPKYLEVEVSTACNLKCTMCEHTYWCEKNQNMTYDEFIHIIDQFPDLKWIGLTGIGESYLNPDFKRMMEECKRRNMFIENFDNFVFLTPEHAEHLVDIGMDKLYVSLDAATKETYEKIRVGAKWEEVIDHIVTLDRIKKKKKKYAPELWFHFIISKDNVHEVEAYLDMIADLNIDVHQVQYTILLHPYKEIEDKYVDFPDERKIKVQEKAAKMGIKVGFNTNTSDVKSRHHYTTCTAWTQPFIFVDGTVIACCSMNEQNDRPWQRETALGNILKEDMNVIWERMGKMVDSRDEGTCPPQCERCRIFNNEEECPNENKC